MTCMEFGRYDHTVKCRVIIYKTLTVSPLSPVSVLLGGAAVGHKDVVITTIITVHEVKMVECQPDSTI